MASEKAHSRWSQPALLWAEGVWGRWLAFGWTVIYALFVVWRSEFVTSKLQDRYQVPTMLAHVPLVWGLTALLVIVVGWAFEASYRAQARVMSERDAALTRIDVLLAQINAPAPPLAPALSVIVDPTNPHEKFWTKSRRRDEYSGDGFVYGWEYRAEVANNGPTTLQNVMVTFDDRETGQHHDAEKGPPLELDPGQRKPVNLFFACSEWTEDQEGDTHDPVPSRIALRATARDTPPSLELWVDFLPSRNGYDDTSGPYEVTIAERIDTGRPQPGGENHHPLRGA